MKKIIVSHKRPDRVTTTQHIANCSICVPESQREEYERYNDVEIIAHPDTVVGLSPKRQWIVENYPEHFQLDDDIIGARRVYCPKKYHRAHAPTPQEVSDWIDDLAEIAREAGCYLFGFNSAANPVGYTGAAPIRMNKYLTGGAFGLLKGHKIYFPDWPEFVGEDYWLSAYNAFVHRKSFIDARLGFTFENTEVNVGGVSEYRTEQRRKETYVFLKKHFGDAIEPKKWSPIKPVFMKWEKSLKIPF